MTVEYAQCNAMRGKQFPERPFLCTLRPLFEQQAILGCKFYDAAQSNYPGHLVPSSDATIEQIKIDSSMALAFSSVRSSRLTHGLSNV